MKILNQVQKGIILGTVLFTSNLVAGTWENKTYMGSYGARDYKVYVPENLSKAHSAPLVVMLHGCDQTAEQFAKGSRISQWADKEKFIVLLPEQNIVFNPFRCWNWVIPTNNTRVGESQVVIEIMDEVAKKHEIDSKNTFAVGMSAGASMVSILGNCHPERFKALSSHDGTQYYASATGLDFAQVVLSGASVPPNVAATNGYACSFAAKDKPTQMPIIIFHGMNSPLMSPVHAFQIEDEFKAFNDYLDNGRRDNSYYRSKDVINVAESKIYGYNLYTTTNQKNEVIIARYMIDKLGHDWSGGEAGLKYNDPNGPDATALTIKFFKKFGL